MLLFAFAFQVGAFENLSTAGAGGSTAGGGGSDCTTNCTFTGVLTVNGTTASTFAGAVSSTKFLAGDGSGTNPAFAFTSNPDTGMFIINGNRLTFAIDGSNQLQIYSSHIEPQEDILPNAGGTLDFGSNGRFWRKIWGKDGNFTGTVTSTKTYVTGETAGQAACIRADKSIGTCSSAVGAGGACTCN